MNFSDTYYLLVILLLLMQFNLETQEVYFPQLRGSEYSKYPRNFLLNKTFVSSYITTHDVTAIPRYIPFVIDQNSSSSNNTVQVTSFESLPGFERHLT